ncbi:MAG: ExbD/TolR family protein [Betaproteobacteria bacterium]
MRPRRLKNEINVVPYIDVMLVLLVIFMVAAPMMTTGSVNLPAAGSAPDSKPDKFVRVQIKEDGSLSTFDLAGKETKLTNLKELKRQLATFQATTPIMVAGDMSTQYKNVVEALNEVKQAGFQRVGLETAVK